MIKKKPARKPAKKVTKKKAVKKNVTKKKAPPAPKVVVIDHESEVEDDGFDPIAWAQRVRAAGGIDNYLRGLEERTAQAAIESHAAIEQD